MNTKDLLGWMCKEFRPFLVRPREQGGVGWVNTDCIRTAKMAIALLKRFGIEAQELSVFLLIINPAMAEYLKKHKDPRFPPPADARVVKMGRDKGEATFLAGNWRGHLPVIVENNYLLDLTVDSANVEKGINLQPFFITLGQEGVKQLNLKGELVISAPNGEKLSYQASPNNEGYKETTAWTVWSAFHQEIIEVCKKAYEKDSTTKK
jgi:hypothetical protein